MQFELLFCSMTQRTIYYFSKQFILRNMICNSIFYIYRFNNKSYLCLVENTRRIDFNLFQVICKDILKVNNVLSTELRCRVS